MVEIISKIDILDNFDWRQEILRGMNFVKQNCLK